MRFFFLYALFVSSLQCFAVEKLPIVYHEGYNVSFGETTDWITSFFHPFNGSKYGHVYNYLVNYLGISKDQFYTPEMVSYKDLLKVHTQEYLDSLKSSSTISRAIDLKDALFLIPNSILQKKLLNPMRLATGGTILAAQLALEHGWAINLSGGYHHAKREEAGGGCIFGDIQLAIEKLWEEKPKLKVLIIDLDAHQGNGHEDYFKKSFGNQDRKVFIFDMYNKNEYPFNKYWDKPDGSHVYIDKSIALDGGNLACKIGSLNVTKLDYGHFTEHVEVRKVTTNEYLEKLKKELPAYLEQLFQQDNKPDLIIYNAGTDPFEKDTWGCMQVSFEGMVERDIFVWEQAQKNNIPIVMVPSGGYSLESSKIMAQSIERILHERKVLTKHTFDSEYSGIKKVNPNQENIVYKRAGLGLVGLGFLGNLVAYINTLEPQQGSYMERIKNICSYPVPECSYDPGLAKSINGFCTQFWQKSLFFTLTGILPGAFLLWSSWYKKSVQEKSQKKRSV